MIEVIGAANGVFGILQGVQKVYAAYQENQSLRTNTMRMLAVEVEQNITVLDACHISTRRGPTVTDPGYLAVARALRTEAHLAILMVAGFKDDEKAVRERQKRANELRDNILDDVTLTFDEGGIETHVRLGDAAKKSSPKKKRLDESKPVGLLEASAFVVSRVAALNALADVVGEAGEAVKMIRPRTRLKTVMAYERAIQRELNRQDVIPRIRLESEKDG